MNIINKNSLPIESGSFLAKFAMTSVLISSFLGFTFFSTVTAISQRDVGTVAPANDNRYNFSPWVSDLNGSTDLPYTMMGYDNNVFREVMFQAHVGNDNRIYLRWAEGREIVGEVDLIENYDIWSGWATSSNPHESTRLPVSLFQFNKDVYMIHVGSDNKIYTKQEPYSDLINNGVSGHWVTSDNPYEQTKHPVSVTNFNDNNYQVHVGTDNRIYYKSSSEPTAPSNWQTSTDPNEFTDKAVDISASGDRIYKAHVGANNRIYIKASANGVDWTGWQTSTDPNEFTDKAVSIHAMGRDLYITHVGADKKIYTTLCRDVEDFTRIYQNCDGWTQYGGVTEKALTLTDYEERLHQGHVGLDGKMYWRQVNP
jgi:hypothetical protein